MSSTSYDQTCWFDLLLTTDQPGFYTQRPKHYGRALHNSRKSAVYWHSDLSFAAYSWPQWLQGWADSSLRSWQQQCALEVWSQGEEEGWSLDIFSVLRLGSRLGSSVSDEDYDTQLHELVRVFNEFVVRLKNDLRLAQGQYLDQDKQLQQQQERNLQTALQALETLKARYSKLLVLRVDLYYQDKQTGLVQLQQDRQQFFKRSDREGCFQGLVHYIWVVEYGTQKGLHLHLLAFYDGHKHQKDTYIAQQLGDYWVQVTEGRGAYYNTNTTDNKQRLTQWQRSEDYLKRLQRNFGQSVGEANFYVTQDALAQGKATLGIGMVQAQDHISWLNIELVVRYLCKYDQKIPSHLRQDIRTFGQSQRIQKPVQGGRPRNS